MSTPSILSVALLFVIPSVRAQQPAPTHEFRVHDERAWLDGVPVDLWGIHCGNALKSRPLTERLVRGLDAMADHGVNLVSVHLQAANGGHPDRMAGANLFSRRGELDPCAADRLEWLCREADRRGMVVMVHVLCGLWDQELEDETAVRHAIETTARTLRMRGLRNVFVDLAYEFDHPTRIDHEIYREPDGAAKKARMAAWFHDLAPDIAVGVTTAAESKGSRDFPGMDVRMIQKGDPIPAQGFVVDTEPGGGDRFKDDGVFTADQRAAVVATCETYRGLPHAAMIWNSGFAQGITGASGTAPHFEIGGNGTGQDDRGVRVYFDWVQEHVGRWRDLHHEPATDVAAVQPEAPRPFRVVGGAPQLGDVELHRFGLAVGNALCSEAVTERFLNNLSNLAGHGFGAIQVALTGDDSAGTPVASCRSAFTTAGALREDFARRLERLVRAADAESMLVVVTVLGSARDRELDGAVAVQQAIESTGRFLVENRLQNVVVELATHLDDATRGHAVLGASPSARLEVLVRWFRGVAPNILCGVILDPREPALDEQGLGFAAGPDVPRDGTWIVTGLPLLDCADCDGCFDDAARARIVESIRREARSPNAIWILRSAYAIGITNGSGSGPYAEMGGYGSSPDEIGLRACYEAVAAAASAGDPPR